MWLAGKEIVVRKSLVRGQEAVFLHTTGDNIDPKEEGEGERLINMECSTVVALITGRFLMVRILARKIIKILENLKCLVKGILPHCL